MGYSIINPEKLVDNLVYMHTMPNHAYSGSARPFTPGAGPG